MNFAQELPFYKCSDYQVIRECLSTSERLLDLFKNNEFANQIKGIVNSFTSENYNCNYYNTSNFPHVLKEHNEDCLKAIHINIRSFEKNKFKLIYPAQN